MKTIELTSSNGQTINVVVINIETFKENPNIGVNSFVTLKSKKVLAVKETVNEIRELLDRF